VTIRDPAGSSGHARIFRGPALAAIVLAGEGLTGTGLTGAVLVGNARRTEEGATGIKERGLTIVGPCGGWEVPTETGSLIGGTASRLGDSKNN
jgi:hypothetical protein